jgi:hypothetical protein
VPPCVPLSLWAMGLKRFVWNVGPNYKVRIRSLKGLWGEWPLASFCRRRSLWGPVPRPFLPQPTAAHPARLPPLVLHSYLAAALSLSSIDLAELLRRALRLAWNGKKEWLKEIVETNEWGSGNGRCMVSTTWFTASHKFHSIYMPYMCNYNVVKMHAHK